MRIVIDRFEGNIAVVELSSGKIIDCPRELLPENSKEGTIINITVDEEATKERLNRVTEKMNRLFKD